MARSFFATDSDVPWVTVDAATLTFTPQAGTFTSVTGKIKYKKIGKLVLLVVRFTGTVGVTGPLYISAPLPTAIANVLETIEQGNLHWWSGASIGTSGALSVVVNGTFNVSAVSTAATTAFPTGVLTVSGQAFFELS